MTTKTVARIIVSTVPRSKTTRAKMIRTIPVATARGMLRSPRSPRSLGGAGGTGVRGRPGGAERTGRDEATGMGPSAATVAAAAPVAAPTSVTPGIESTGLASAATAASSDAAERLRRRSGRVAGRPRRPRGSGVTVSGGAASESSSGANA